MRKLFNAILTATTYGAMITMNVTLIGVCGYVVKGMYDECMRRNKEEETETGSEEA
jgi:hypothetical protein